MVTDLSGSSAISGGGDPVIPAVSASLLPFSAAHQQLSLSIMHAAQEAGDEVSSFGIIIPRVRNVKSEAV